MPEVQFKGTAHYIWRRDDRIGHGAFGSVFKGFCKESGEPVAIKAVHNLSQQTLYQHDQELSILKQLNHPNVVKFIGVEETTDGSKIKVLVMEFCEAGSLHDVLQEPAHAFGIPDDHFLLVILHLTEGLRHLRSHQFVHRDIKPSNVLRTHDNRGQVVYKLCDFGAARSLDDQQEFMSLVGTEEYLHPDIYKKAFFGGGTLGKKFHAYTDLWSLGVLVYQLATGDLPFRPYGGRKNKMTMHQMTVAKPECAIAGVQREPNGKICYYSELPAFSALSLGLQPHVSQLLRGLVQIDPNKLWSYADFFAQSDRILRMRPGCKVFDVPSAQTLRVYLEETSLHPLLTELQRQLCRPLTGPNVDGFLLSSAGHLVSLSANASRPILESDSTFYLWSGTREPLSNISTLPSKPRLAINDHVLTRTVDAGDLGEAGTVLMEDRLCAKECLAVCCWIQAKIDRRRDAERRMNDFTQLVRMNTSVVLSGLEKKLITCQQKWTTLQRVLEYLEKM